MTVVVIGSLVVLAGLDGAFSGFRSSLGRSGLVDHTAEDRRGLGRGVALVTVLALPAVLSLVLDTALAGTSLGVYRGAGLAFLAVVGPYAAVVCVALAAYGVLRWQLRYLASALILGPFTLLRPYLVLVASALAVRHARSVGVAITAVLAVAAVLLVEPILDRRPQDVVRTGRGSNRVA